MREKLKEKIAETLRSARKLINENVSDLQYADAILALLKDSEPKWYNAGWEDCMKELPSLDGIVVEEKCKHPTTIRKLTETANAYDIHTIANCPFCHETGTITRPAGWRDIDLKGMIEALRYHSNYQLRLKVKE